MWCRFTTTFGVDASYTGQTMAMYDRAPRRIPEALQSLLNAVAEATGTDFNFVLMNFYQDGTHSISYHSDDEKFLGMQHRYNLIVSHTMTGLRIGKCIVCCECSR